MSALRPLAATIGAAPGVGDEAATADGATDSFVTDEGLGAVVGADGAAAAADAPADSSTATTVPSETLSPTLTFNSRTTPATLDGTSIVALSDSSVSKPWSTATVSPTATSTSITGTSS